MHFNLTTSASTFPCFQINWYSCDQLLGILVERRVHWGTQDVTKTLNRMCKTAWKQIFNFLLIYNIFVDLDIHVTSTNMIAIYSKLPYYSLNLNIGHFINVFVSVRRGEIQDAIGMVCCTVVRRFVKCSWNYMAFRCSITKHIH